MNNMIPYAILDTLISSESFLSAQELAEHLHVSRRTIFNNMSEVRHLCEQHHAQFITMKSKGYKVEAYYALYLFLKERRLEYKQPNNEECKLYIIYLLLNDEQPVHISELKEIMYLSRPTIYKMLADIQLWFEDLGIKVEINRKGVSIQYGERRYRQALKNWIVETKNLLDKAYMENQNYHDYFKFGKSINEILMMELSSVYKAVKQISEECNVFCSTVELQNMTMLLEVMIYQNHRGHIVELSERLQELTISFYSAKKLHLVSNILSETLTIDFPVEEIVYFITSLLINGDLTDRTLLNNRINDLDLNIQLISDIKQYLIQKLNVDSGVFEELIEDISFIIKREVLFQIKGSFGTHAKHYDSMLKNFKATVGLAQDVYQIIVKYYHIQYFEKLICNITFSLLSAIQLSKKNLRAVLIHNCDSFECKYVLLELQKFPYSSLIYSTDQLQEFHEFVDKHEVDVIFSTVNFQHPRISVLEISKMFGRLEKSEIIKQLDYLHIITNFNRIIIS